MDSYCQILAWGLLCTFGLGQFAVAQQKTSQQEGQSHIAQLPEDRATPEASEEQPLSEEQRDRRLKQICLVASSLFVSLFAMFVCFKINHATRGFYAGRLQFIGVITILVVVAFSIYIGRLLE